MWQICHSIKKVSQSSLLRSPFGANLPELPFNRDVSISQTIEALAEVRQKAWARLGTVTTSPSTSFPGNTHRNRRLDSCCLLTSESRRPPYGCEAPHGASCLQDQRKSLRRNDLSLLLEIKRTPSRLSLKPSGGVPWWLNSTAGRLYRSTLETGVWFSPCRSRQWLSVARQASLCSCCRRRSNRFNSVPQPRGMLCSRLWHRFWSLRLGIITWRSLTPRLVGVTQGVARAQHNLPGLRGFVQLF